MARIVKIELDSQQNIKVIVDDVLKKTITRESRETNAMEIYESLDCDFENQYEIAPIQVRGQESEATYDVLKAFYGLYEVIINDINGIFAKKTLDISNQDNEPKEDD